MSIAEHRPLSGKTWWLLAVLIAACGGFSVWYASVWGIGVSPDSAEYLAAARRLHGIGDLLHLPTQWAPLYPVLLKVASFFGPDIFVTTRWLQSLLMAANLLAALWVLQTVTASYRWQTLVCGVLLLCNFKLWQIAFFAWSEAPFVLCQLLSALCLLRFWQQGGLRWLLWCALFAALAQLFRYAGVAWIGTVCLLLLYRSRTEWRAGLRHGVLFGALALLPFILWLLINKWVRDETTNRTLVMHLITPGDLRELMLQLGSWVGGSAGVLGGAAGLLLTALLVRQALLHKQAASSMQTALMHTGVAYALCYTLFILLSKSFFDAYIPFDDRIFVPAWLFASLALLTLLQWLWDLAVRLERRAVALLCVLLASTGLAQLVPDLLVTRLQGQGYFSAYMAQVSDVNAVPALVSRTVYTNAPDFLRMMTDYTVQDYPRKYAPTTKLANPLYQQALDTMQQQVQAETALLVHYQGFEWRAYFPQRDELLKLGYVPVMEGNGVEVLSYPTSPSATQTPATNQ